jgi:hypothetical protein
MLVPFLQKSNQIVSTSLIDLANKDPQFRERKITIGTKSYNMEINLREETQK